MPTSPLSATYLDLQVARASAALPAAGAWDTAPLALVCPFFDKLTLFFTYTRGGAGGAFEWQIEVSAYSRTADVPTGAAEWVTESIYASGGVSAGSDTTSLVQRELQKYTSQGAAAEGFVFGPIDFGCAIERVRILARESGVTGTPGILQVEAKFS